jgi:hypothetical protein
VFKILEGMTPEQQEKFIEGLSAQMKDFSIHDKKLYCFKSSCGKQVGQVDSGNVYEIVLASVGHLMTVHKDDLRRYLLRD